MQLPAAIETDISQMPIGSNQNLQHPKDFDKRGEPNCPDDGRPGEPAPRRGSKGMVFSVIETHLSCRFRSDA
jgi:hypothetical protein